MLLISGLIPTRVVIGIMMFLACAISYMTRVTISFNLIAMVDVIKSNSSTSHVSECIAMTNNNNLTSNDTELPAKLRDASDVSSNHSN